MVYRASTGNFKIWRTRCHVMPNSNDFAMVAEYVYFQKCPLKTENNFSAKKVSLAIEKIENAKHLPF